MAQTKIISGGITDSSVTNVKIADVAASKLTGDLPAISGANLTNLPSETKPTSRLVFHQVLLQMLQTAVTINWNKLYKCSTSRSN